MSYFDDIWGNLAFNAGDAAGQIIGTVGWHRRNTTGDLKYVSQSAYKSVLVHSAKQFAMSVLEGELNSVLSKYEKNLQAKQLQHVRQTPKIDNKLLIDKGEKSVYDYGSITCQGGHVLRARTKYGTLVPEALILSFDSDKPVTYHDVMWDDNAADYHKVKEQNTLETLWNPKHEILPNSRNDQPTSFTTTTVFHIDLAPKVSMNSSKNIVMTSVQGRDFTRKELVAGGDLTYNVSGSIVSNDVGVYPAESVKRFIKIMQYNGPVNVNFITFGLLGVKQILIKSFALEQAEYKNIQPYNFQCVAIEPQDSLTIASDTIASVNKQLSALPQDKWYHDILNNKLGRIAANTAVNTATNAATSAVSLGLDKLVPNI